MLKAILVPKNSNEEKKQVEVSFGQHSLQLTLTSSEICQLPYETISWQIGGNRNSLLFLSADGLQEAKLYLEISNELMQQLKNVAGLARLHADILRQQRQSFKKSLWLYSAIGLILFSLINWRGPIFGGLGARIPFSWEKSIADQIFKAKLNQQQQEIQEELTRFFTEHIKDENWQGKFTFHISSDNEPNAYATIGGHIYINRGLISELKTPEQLLGVVGHEMEHVKKRHVIRSLSQALGLFSIFQIILGDVSGLAAILVDQGGPILNLQYSRELEEEADTGAMKVLVQSGVNPIGLSEALAIILAQQEKIISQNVGGEVLQKLQQIEILSSHPDPKKRIEALKLEAEKLIQGKQMKKINFDFVHLQNQIKERF